MVYLGLGSNLGDRAGNLAVVLKALQEKSSLIDLSAIYKTEPVGFLEQPKFLNAVCLISTDLSPREILPWVKEIERKIGPRAPFRNGPRYADIDILFYDDLVLETPDLVIPHSRLAERAFVLVPLAEIAPEFVHPVLKRPITELLGSLRKPWGVEKVQMQLLPADLLKLYPVGGRQQVGN